MCAYGTYGSTNTGQPALARPTLFKQYWSGKLVHPNTGFTSRFCCVCTFEPLLSECTAYWLLQLTVRTRTWALGHGTGQVLARLTAVAKTRLWSCCSPGHATVLCTGISGFQADGSQRRSTDPTVQVVSLVVCGIKKASSTFANCTRERSIASTTTMKQIDAQVFCICAK